MAIAYEDFVETNKQILLDNPPARSDPILSRNLFRKAIRDGGKSWENAAFDLVFQSVAQRVRAEETAARAEEAAAKLRERASKSAPSAAALKAAEDRVAAAAVEAQKLRERESAAAKDRGKSRFARNRDAIAAMRFANGKGILEQTVADIQAYGSWMSAILLALPKAASASDEIGKFLTLDQLATLRTFDVR